MNRLLFILFLVLSTWSCQQAPEIYAAEQTIAWGTHRGDAVKGKALALDYCTGCHVIDDQGHAIKEAPPFEVTANREGLTTEELRLWLRDPIKVKPGTHMPNLGLNGAQIEDLIAFLYTYHKAKLAPNVD